MKEVVGIIGGNGKMGQAFAQFFQKKGYPILISDIHSDLSNIDVAKKSDILMVSVPIPLFDSIIEEVSPFLKKDALLCDITSIKAEPVQKMLSSFAGSVLGLHPMFGPTNLSVGQTIVFCSGRGGQWEEKMREIFAQFSCVSLSAEEHDKAMALVQGVQHFMEVAYGATLSKIGFPLPSLLQVASPVYRMQMALMGRVLSQDEKMYSKIVFGSEYSKEAIHAFLECTTKIVEKGQEEFEKEFQQARKYFGDFCSQAQAETDEFIDLLAARQDVSQVSLRSRETAKIGTLGPEFTWSHLAGEKFFPSEEIALFPNFSSIFSALQSGHISEAFVPIENTISGTVREVWEEISHSLVHITAVYEFPIEHVLSAKSFGKVKKIFGHAAALAQCRKNLIERYPKVKYIPVASNSEALVRAQTVPDSAAISSKEAAEKAFFSILHEHIADKEGNTTRFALIQKGPPPSSNGEITSLFFSLKNVSGSLFRALEIFHKNGINMTRLESCPASSDFSEYAFYADIEGSFSDTIRHHLEEVAKDVKILGSYSVVR